MRTDRKYILAAAFLLSALATTPAEAGSTNQGHGNHGQSHSQPHGSSGSSGSSGANTNNNTNQNANQPIANATGGSATGGSATGGAGGSANVANVNHNSANNTSSATGGTSSATGGTSSANNNGNNNGGNGNNGNNNSSSSNAQNQSQTQSNQQSQSNQNDNANSNNSSQDVAVNTYNPRAPVNTAFAAPLVTGEDTCMGSSSLGAQAVTFGLSLGTTWQDANCRRLKNSRQLVALGYPRAATALMCVDADVRHAMEEAGTPCPSGPAPEPVVLNRPVVLAPAAPVYIAPAPPAPRPARRVVRRPHHRAPMSERGS